MSDPVGLSDCLSSFHAFLFSAESSDESAASELLDNVSSILHSVRVSLHLRNVLLRLWVWLGARPRALMVSQWNFTLNFDIFWDQTWLTL